MGWQEHAKDLDELAANTAERHQQDGADAAAAQLMSKVYARYGRLSCATLDDETLGRLLFASVQALSALRDAQASEEGDTDGPA